MPFVGGMNELFFALDTETGEVKWRVDFPKRLDTDVSDGDGVFTSSYPNYSHFFEVTMSATGYDVREAWRHKTK